ncbi:ABC transporter permease [Tunicatimonas pelagia]|uniref:ABC transporter permease n=1 Tax=Tunicatimonas pelagia TaxID=931531 RepID=UPI0026652B0F|nr:ABC transporter permease [Tunicatimonas pelagia]WKN43659.1 permease prefix domain 2-containing transporter [Tunicatimonas pelagia]
MSKRKFSYQPPPRWVDKLLRHLCAPELLEEILGDLHERYYLRAKREGEAKARRTYWQEVLAYLRPAIFRRPSNTSISNDMLKNYFTLALRLFARNKLTTAINVLGLALALTGSLLIAMFIQDELSYDRYHKNADHIYRVTRDFLSSDGSLALHLGHTAPGFGPRLANDFPDILEVARIWHTNITLGTVDENRSFQESLNVENLYYAEPSVFEVFTIPILAGDFETALENPFTMMLSDAAAEKYFGTQDVVGKQLLSQDNYFEITGVYEAFPTQSHWHPDFLVAFSTLNTILGQERLEAGWGDNVFGTYLLVNDEFDPRRVEAQFPDFLDRHMSNPDVPVKPSSWTNLYLQPLTSIHLHSQLDAEEEANGNINYIYIIGAIGVFLLLIAGFNFINLSTARATTRSKEVGLRKAIGAFRQQLILQHLSESVLLAFFAFLLSVVLISLALPWLNEFADKTIELSQYTTPTAVLGVIAIIVLVGILAGIYPAFIISGFRPVLALKGRSVTTRQSGRVRQALVVVQFTVSIVMIIATLITYQQLTFLNDQELGYAKDQVIFLSYTDEIDERFETFYHELTEHPAILNATRSSLVPTARLTAYQGTAVQQGDSMVTTDVIMKDVRIDHNYFDTYQIPIVSGRNFSENIGSDDSTNFIINETAARMVGWTNEEAIGQTLKNGRTIGTVVGVVQDFHFESLHQPIVPVVFHGQHMFNELSVLVSKDDMPEALAHMEAVWEQFVPQQSFDYLFLNEHYQQLYHSEQKQSKLFIIFAGLAILIAAMGLFGLATFSTLQRTKEVSIRKVLGAPIGSILKLLSKEVFWLVFIANLVAWPIAWYFMREWLSSFAYHIEMNLLTYLAAGIVTLVITLITISSQTIKAALTNPATILRND